MQDANERVYADVCWRMLTYADVCWRADPGDKELVKDANERVQKLAKKILYIAIVIGVAQAGA